MCCAVRVCTVDALLCCLPLTCQESAGQTHLGQPEHIQLAAHQDVSAMPALSTEQIAPLRRRAIAMRSKFKLQVEPEPEPAEGSPALVSKRLEIEC